MTALKRWIPLVLIALFALSACRPLQELEESGKYDEAISKIVRKLRGKKKKNPKYVFALEEVFRRANARDMATVEALAKEGYPENWEKINDIHRGIARRQQLIEPLIPLEDKDGYVASFQFVEIGELEKESREKAATYLYAKAGKLLIDAEAGDKGAAREAYHSLSKIDQYFRDYRDKEELMDKALQLGRTYVLFKLKNDAPGYLPAGFENELTRISVRDLNSKWEVYFLNEEAVSHFDYGVVLHLTDLHVGPEVVREREYLDTKEIDDGFDYVLDENGNVMKDTAGNDIKIPRTKLITATIFETFQNKAATVRGRVEVVDYSYNEIVKSFPLTVDAIFENYASTFRGDKRALSKDSRRRIGNVPQPFPTNEELLLEAAENLKPAVKDRLRESRQWI